MNFIYIKKKKFIIDYHKLNKLTSKVLSLLIKYINSMLNRLQSADLYRKVGSDYQQSTATGGFLSFISGIVMIVLLLSETIHYIRPQTTSKLIVEPHSDQDYMLISVNISFLTLPCNSLVTYYTDISHEHYTFYNLNRSTLDNNGKIIENEAKKVIIEEKVEGCGSCYGAEIFKGQCCNTCSEVMETYGRKKWKPPKFSDITQCRVFLTLDSSKGPGCMLTGNIKVKKIPGSIHFRNTLDFDRSVFTKYTGFHKINNFAFKDSNSEDLNIAGPVDGTFIDKGYSTNYYMKVMPAIMPKGRFYQASSNYLTFDRVMNPEILFTYDLEPITTVFEEDKKFTEFLVSVCAIIGGWYSITLLLARLLIK